MGPGVDKAPLSQGHGVGLSTSVRSFSWYPGGSLALEVIIPWDVGATEFNKLPPATTDISPEGIERRMAQLRAGFDHLPLGEVIQELTGVDLQLYRDQLEHSGAEDPFWAPVSFRSLLAEWTVPTLLVDGWHDYPLPGVFEDYAALKRSPAPVRLRIGAGGHLGGGRGGRDDRRRPRLVRHLATGTRGCSDRPVTIEVQGEGGGWRELEDWPPPSVPTRWYLHPEGRHEPEPPASRRSRPLPLRPGRPHPFGGRDRHADRRSGRQPALEGRPDVLVYTSDALIEPLEIVGAVAGRPVVGSSLDHTDFFVRLCDVHPDGRSINVCDGLQRFEPTTIRRAGDGTFRATVAMWPAGHRFAAGHRLRIQVSSGAHPVYARNLGTGEPPLTATLMQAADQAVYHEPGRLSSVGCRTFGAEATRCQLTPSRAT